MLRAALGAAACAAAAAGSDAGSEWEAWRAAHRRAYASPSEEALRRGNFARRMAEAARLQAANPLATFGANDLADWSDAELASLRGLRPRGPRNSTAPLYTPEDVRRAEAASVNWREKGAVTPVKDQKSCGGCWAFSATGNMEGQWFLAGNKLTSLSEQMLISCSSGGGGCGGGLFHSAFKWVETNGIATEAQYPYTAGGGNSGSCITSKETPVVFKLSSYKDLPHGASNEGQILTWMQKNGPVSIGVDASGWSSYKGGIMTSCQSSNLDHGVLLVGYGEDNGQAYFIVKNSWGPSWGEDGYIRLAYGKNLCGLTQEAATSII